MGFIGIDPFLQVLANFRVCWFRGRLRGGKTSLCFRIAGEMLKRGDCKYLYSNIDCVFGDDLDVVGKDTVYILDEGGSFLRSGRYTEKFMLGLGKINSYIFVPSFLRPSYKVCYLDCQMTFHLLNIGIPVRFYKWTLKDGKSYTTGNFTWINTNEVYGVYSSKSVAFDDGGALDALQKAVSTLPTKRRNSRQFEKDIEEAYPNGERTIDVLDELMDEMDAIRGQLDDLETAQDKTTRFISLLPRARHKT